MDAKMTEAADQNEHDDVIWQVGVFDAHCHPTDIKASIKDISSMRARVLTIMSSRSQDQELVSQAASKYLLRSKADLDQRDSRYVIPAFGWHPWFSHQLYDDRAAHAEFNKSEHYRQVLTPSPDKEEFIHTLPEPLALTKFIEEMEEQLRQFPVALVGEVGLDRSFRLPVAPFSSPGDASHKTGGHADGEYTPGSREGRALTPYRVSMDHQKTVLRVQLELAAKLRLPVSIHSVQAHGVVFDLLQSMWAGHEKPSKSQQKRRRSAAGAHAADDAEDEEIREHDDKVAKSQSDPDREGAMPFPTRICMHSYTGPAEPLKQFLNRTVPADIFFSFSHVINFSTPSATKVTDVIKAVPDSQILIESDFHCAGEKMDGLLLQIIYKVCEIKGWDLANGTERLRSNWERFIFG